MFVCLRGGGRPDYAGAAVLIAVTTWGLSAFQDWLSQMEDRPVRAFAVAYLPALALTTLLA